MAGSYSYVREAQRKEARRQRHKEAQMRKEPKVPSLFEPPQKTNHDDQLSQKMKNLFGNFIDIEVGPMLKDNIGVTREPMTPQTAGPVDSTALFRGANKAVSQKDTKPLVNGVGPRSKEVTERKGVFDTFCKDQAAVTQGDRGPNSSDQPLENNHRSSSDREHRHNKAHGSSRRKSSEKSRDSASGSSDKRTDHHDNRSDHRHSSSRERHNSHGSSGIGRPEHRASHGSRARDSHSPCEDSANSQAFLKPNGLLKALDKVTTQDKRLKLHIPERKKDSADANMCVERIMQEMNFDEPALTGIITPKKEDGGLGFHFSGVKDLPSKQLFSKSGIASQLSVNKHKSHCTKEQNRMLRRDLDVSSDSDSEAQVVQPRHRKESLAKVKRSPKHSVSSESSSSESSSDSSSSDNEEDKAQDHVPCSPPIGMEIVPCDNDREEGELAPSPSAAAASDNVTQPQPQSWALKNWEAKVKESAENDLLVGKAPDQDAVDAMDKSNEDLCNELIYNNQSLNLPESISLEDLMMNVDNEASPDRAAQLRLISRTPPVLLSPTSPLVSPKQPRSVPALKTDVDSPGASSTRSLGSNHRHKGRRHSRVECNVPLDYVRPAEVKVKVEEDVPPTSQEPIEAVSPSHRAADRLSPGSGLGRLPPPSPCSKVKTEPSPGHKVKASPGPKVKDTRSPSHSSRSKAEPSPSKPRPTPSPASKSRHSPHSPSAASKPRTDPPCPSPTSKPEHSSPSPIKVTRVPSIKVRVPCKPSPASMPKKARSQNQKSREFLSSASSDSDSDQSSSSSSDSEADDAETSFVDVEGLVSPVKMESAQCASVEDMLQEVNSQELSAPLLSPIHTEHTSPPGQPNSQPGLSYVDGRPSILVQLDVRLLDLATLIAQSPAPGDKDAPDPAPPDKTKSAYTGAKEAEVLDKIFKDRQPVQTKIPKRKHSESRSRDDTKRQRTETSSSQRPTATSTAHKEGISHTDDHKWDRKHPARSAHSQDDAPSSQPEARPSPRPSREASPAQWDRSDRSSRDRAGDKDRDRDHYRNNDRNSKDWDAPAAGSPRTLSPIPNGHHSAGEQWSQLVTGTLPSLPARRQSPLRRHSPRPPPPQLPQFAAPDTYLEQARRLKHKADALNERFPKSVTYVEAVVSFLQCGNAMEQDNVSEPKNIYTMYQNTLTLLRHICKFRGSQESDSINDKEKKLAVLSARIQSLLSLKLFKLKRSEASKLKRVLDDFNSKTTQTKPLAQAPSPYQTNWNTRSTGTPSPMSPQPSPAGSVGSVGSVGSGNGDHQVPNGTTGPLNTLSVAPQASAGCVSIPNRIHSVTTQYLTHVHNLYHAHDMWEQADTQAAEYREFFGELDSEVGALSLHSSMWELVRYIQAGLQQLKDT